VNKSLSQNRVGGIQRPRNVESLGGFWTCSKIGVVSALVLLGALGVKPCLAESASENSPALSELEMTILRYFTGQSGYQAGNLMTRSQVEELQQYLRRTRRRGPACHPRLLRRMLPDNCRLAKLFYSKNGDQVLRDAAQRLGGYAVLEALTRSTDSYTRLVEAVGSGSVDSVMELARSYVTAQAESKKKRRNRVIYTLDEFFSATTAATENAKGREMNHDDTTGTTKTRRK